MWKKPQETTARTRGIKRKGLGYEYPSLYTRVLKLWRSGFFVSALSTCGTPQGNSGDNKRRIERRLNRQSQPEKAGFVYVVYRIPKIPNIPTPL